MNSRFSLPLLVGALVGCVGALGLVVGVFGNSSDRLGDRLSLPRSVDTRIAIVAIDDASLERIGRWPWARSTHASLIQKLKQAGVSTIGYDVNFPEASTGTEDDALASALQSAGSVVLPIELPLEQKNSALVYDPQHVVRPLPVFLRNAQASGHSNTPLDDDGVVRRIPLTVAAPDGSPIPAFAYAVGSVGSLTPRIEDIPREDYGLVRVHFPNAPRASFPTISAANILQGTADLTQLKDKIVFVGATAHDLHDEYYVPTSRRLPMSGVEIHASFLNTLLQRSWLRPVSIWLQALLLILAGLLLGLFVSRLRLRTSILLALGLWIAWMGTGFFLFDRGYLLNLVWPTLVLVFGYLILSIERWITTERTKGELRGLFGRYLSPVVLDALLRDPSKVQLGGEKRHMTVLFSDLRGFTTLSEGLAPEALITLMNTYLTAMTDIVFAQKGVLDKYIGDAVMAFWNAPLDQEHHPRLAAEAALHMRDQLHAMNEKNAFGDHRVLKVGIGLHTGDMVVGNVGSATRHDYTVIGDNVNLASRVEGLNKEYGTEILVTAATAQELGTTFLLRKVDVVAVKGKKEAVGLYELVNPTDSASPADLQKVQLFEQALKLYMARAFPEALALCRTLSETFPEDGPTKMLTDRIQYLTDHPPADDWNGTWVMTKK
jgi:adenylate cyclase